MDPNQLSSPEHLAAQHTPEAISARIASSAQQSYVGDFVLGAVDGAVTTFAIVAGAAGAGLSSGVALVLGLANVLADGFSMAASNFLKARADAELVERFRKMEEMHIDVIPDAEREEIRQIFAGKGFDGKTLDTIVGVITRDRRRWVDTMLTEEWGLQLESASPARAAATTFVAFMAAGLAPLVPLLVALQWTAAQAFLASAVVTAVTFLVVGWFRARITEQNPLIGAAETLFVGGAAAALAYFMGAWLHDVFGI